MKNYGITGGIGSGKSLVCKIFATLGVPIYDADSRAKWLMENDIVLMENIKKSFGLEAYLDGHLNRIFLAQEVFSNENKRQMLNALVHPAVGEDAKKWRENQKNAPYTLKEAALLIEAGSYKDLDGLILVLAPTDVRIARVRERDKQRSEQEIKSIIEKQMPDDEKMKFAQYLLNNDGKNLLIPQVLALHHKLKAQN